MTTTRIESRAGSKAAFNHIMKTVLEFEDDSSMMEAMAEEGYDNINDISSMSVDEVMGLK
jgi:hypothetical protein